MKIKNRILTLPIVLTLASAGCATTKLASRRPSSADVSIHILSTTDLHGYAQAQKNKQGILVGGVDYMSAYFDAARDKDAETLLVDSGDLFQGTLLSNNAEGVPIVKVYNYLGYDASTIGNHEFDYGPVGPDTVPMHAGEDPLGALKARISEAKFPFVSANICAVAEDPHQCQDPEHYRVASFTQPYVIVTVHGLQVGIIGLTTDDTAETTMPANVQALKFMPGAAALERYVPKMKSEGADLIVVIAHVGGYCTGDTCNPKDELFHLIDTLKPETRAQIPLILAGHTHNYLNKVYNGVQLLITGCYGHSFGYSTLTLHAADGTVSVDDHQSVDLCQKVYPDTGFCGSGTGTPVDPSFLGNPIVPDADAAQIIADDVAAANAQTRQTVGKLVSPLPKDASAAKPESLMGDFMADSMRFCYAGSDCTQAADVALQNNGGIRADISPAGPVTFGQVFSVIPFDNYIAVAKLTGLELRALFDGLYAHQNSPVQVSGMTIEYRATSNATRTFTNDAGKSQAFPDPITKATMADGSALDETKTYTVIMADFMATGGSGSEFVMAGRKTPATIDYSRKVRDTLVDYFKSNPAGFDYAKMAPRLILK